MWTIYSTVDPAVKRFKTKEIEATQATSSNAGEGVNLAADVSAAAAAASSSDASSLHLPLPASASSLPAATGPSRSFSFTLLLSHMRLRDWLMLIGASEDDFKSELDITILFGSLANFELSVSDPQIAPWATRMLQRTRTTKAHKFREVCHLAEAMGLIADAQRSDDAAVVGSGLGYYLLEPRFTLMGQVHDMTTSDGRDEMWRRLQEACLRVQRHRLLPIGRNGDFPTDEGTAGKTTNPSGPTSPRLPPLESTSDIAIASLADPSTVGTDTQTSTVDASVSDAILRQFPQKKFPHLFRKAHWTMGKKIETSDTNRDTTQNGDDGDMRRRCNFMHSYELNDDVLLCSSVSSVPPSNRFAVSARRSARHRSHRAASVCRQLDELSGARAADPSVCVWSHLSSVLVCSCVRVCSPDSQELLHHRDELDDRVSSRLPPLPIRARGIRSPLDDGRRHARHLPIRRTKSAAADEATTKKRRQQGGRSRRRGCDRTRHHQRRERRHRRCQRTGGSCRQVA